MLVTEKAINGSEDIIAETSAPLAALIEFYRAFNSGDLELMSNNWENSDEASMSNPLGGVKRGWHSIKEVYSNIFSGNARVYVEYYNYTIHRSGVMFCAVGRERGFFQLGEQKIDLAIRTSRTYRLDCGRWHQIHHHGSIDNPRLLAAYQEAVLGKQNA
jgi:hypothetical protein